MPTATKGTKPALPPQSKRRPSNTGRSESGLSRRSSVGSFKTATGASAAASELDEDEQSASDNDETMIRSRSNPEKLQAEESDDAETISHDTGLVAAGDDGAASSAESEGNPAIFNRSSDTDTIHKSPPTSHEGANSHEAVEKNIPRSPLKSASARRELLTPDTALTPTGRNGRRSVRDSHASYQRSDAGDYLDSSRRLSKMTMSSNYPRNSRAPSRAESFMDSSDMEMRESRYRSQSERGGNARSSSRLLAPASVLDFGSVRGGSVRGSFQSVRGPGSRYASSYIEPPSPLRSPSKQGAGIHDRGDVDRMSITSRGTARKPASVMSKMLDADVQVFPGTRIKKYIEPTLNEAMRRVMKQFSGHRMQDHRCNGYPIAVFVGATAVDTGSIIQPFVSGAVSLYFGPGHPKNMASILPEEDRVPAHIPNPKAPTPASLSRRAELRSAITALHTIYELYRGRACAHVCIDSAYVAKAWGTWIPAWEAKGWPGEDEGGYGEGERERWEDEYYERRSKQRRAYDREGSRYMDLPPRRDGYASEGGRYRSSRDSRRPSFDGRDDWLSNDPYADRRSRRGGERGQRSSSRRGGSRRGYDEYSSEEEEYSSRRGGSRRGDDYSQARRRTMRRAPGRRLVDEDLLRELADIRYEFARVERDRQGSAHLYLIDRTNNPADRMARAVAKSEGNLLAQQEEYEALHVDEARFSDDDPLDPEEDQDWLETRSRLSTASRSTKGGGRVGSSRNSIVSNATGRLRQSASLPAGRLRNGARRQLDTFAEEEEYELANEDARSVRSVRTHRSERSRKSTRAERERDEYLARQDRIEAAQAAEVRRSTSAKRSASRTSRLAPPSKGEERVRRSMDVRPSSRMSLDVPEGKEGRVRRSMDVRPAPAVALARVSMDERRGSMDSRRRVIKDVRSQPELRGGSRNVRSALASAALEEEEEEGLEEDYRPARSSFQVNHSPGRGGPRHPRSRMLSEQSDLPEMDDLVPPAPARFRDDNRSIRSRTSTDSRRRPAESISSPKKSGLFGGKTPASPASQKGSGSGRKFGLFSNHSTPSLRAPAPEDEDFDWKTKKSSSPRKATVRGGKRERREWHSTTPNDFGERSGWDDDAPATVGGGNKKQGFFGKLFGRKK